MKDISSQPQVNHMGMTLHIDLLMENWATFKSNSRPQLHVAFFLPLSLHLSNPSSALIFA